jgi:hypothetical protein
MPPNWPAEVARQVQKNPENLFRPEVQALLSFDMLQMLHEAVADSVMMVFGLALAVSILCLAVCCLLPKLPAAPKTPPHGKSSG